MGAIVRGNGANVIFDPELLNAELKDKTDRIIDGCASKVGISSKKTFYKRYGKFSKSSMWHC